MYKLDEYMEEKKLNPNQIYETYQKTIWKIIIDEGGIIEFLKINPDTQYIKDHNTFKHFITAMTLEIFDFIKYEYKKREEEIELTYNEEHKESEEE